MVHSATKYIGGRGDVIAGVVVGPKAFIDEVRTSGMGRGGRDWARRRTGGADVAAHEPAARADLVLDASGR